MDSPLHELRCGVLYARGVNLFDELAALLKVLQVYSS
jgi:hypothetical protein